MKFKIGDEVFCTLSREELEDEESNTAYYCGIDNEMFKACGGSLLTVINTNASNGYRSCLLKSDCFKGTWWFHEADLEFYNLSLENE